jgi:hypothetical protein
VQAGTRRLAIYNWPENARILLQHLLQVAPGRPHATAPPLRSHLSR